MKYFYLITLILVISITNCEQLSDDYDQFLLIFPRAFEKTSAEYQLRKQIFASNVKKYNQINNNPLSTYTLKISNTSDKTTEETSAQRGLRPIENSDDQIVQSELVKSIRVGDVAPPASLNYFAQGKVTQVRNQGSCGSCWAFSSVAYYQSQLKIRGLNYSLSEEASLQCTWRYAPNNRKNDCGLGGYFIDALGFLGKVGSVLRSRYPYLALSTPSGLPSTPGICNDTQRIFISRGTYNSYSNLTTTQIKSLLANHGPLMVGILADSGFMSYANGIYSGCTPGTLDPINHAVLLIGYDGNTNWIIKNQWDTTWGQAGFMRLSMTNDCKMSNYIFKLTFQQPEEANPSVTLNPNTLMNVLPTITSSAEYYHLLSIALLLVLVMIQ